jgi:hypothetical protein
MSRTKIHIQDVITLLHNGVTRLKKDKNYNEDLGSIEEKYGLDAAQVRLLFKNPLLADVRVVPKPKAEFEIVDESNLDESTLTIVQETVEVTTEEEQETTPEEGTIEEIPEETTSSDVAVSPGLDSLT